MILPDGQIRFRARESVNFARENTGEREAVVNKRKVLIDFQHKSARCFFWRRERTIEHFFSLASF
jgi:hypothetical protein